MTPDETFNVAAIGGFFALVVLLALVGLLAAVYTAGCRALDAREERRARRTQTQPEPELADAIDAAVTVALAGDCCDTWWATAGACHDPDTCTHETEA